MSRAPLAALVVVCFVNGCGPGPASPQLGGCVEYALESGKRRLETGIATLHIRFEQTSTDRTDPEFDDKIYVFLVDTRGKGLAAGTYCKRCTLDAEAGYASLPVQPGVNNYQSAVSVTVEVEAVGATHLSGTLVTVFPEAGLVTGRIDFDACPW